VRSRNTQPYLKLGVQLLNFLLSWWSDLPDTKYVTVEQVATGLECVAGSSYPFYPAGHCCQAGRSVSDHCRTATDIIAQQSWTNKFELHDMPGPVPLRDAAHKTRQLQQSFRYSLEVLKAPSRVGERNSRSNMKGKNEVNHSERTAFYISVLDNG